MVTASAPPRPAPVPLAPAPTPPVLRAPTGSGNLEEDLPLPARILSPSLLLPGEAVLFELKPSLWYAFFVSLAVAAPGALVMVLAYSIDVLPETVRHWGAVLGVWGVGLGSALGLLVWLGRTYVLTDRRVLKQKGLLNVQVEWLGLEHVEATFVAQSAVTRPLGLGTLIFAPDGHGNRPHRLTWEFVRRPKEVHGHVVAQIDRWKRALDAASGKGD